MMTAPMGCEVRRGFSIFNLLSSRFGQSSGKCQTNVREIICRESGIKKSLLHGNNPFIIFAEEIFYVNMERNSEFA